jgi:hypothetical protein
MTKFPSSVLIVAISFPFVTVQGMPISRYPNRGSLVVQVADGCGFNKYRDAHGICRRKYILGGRFEKRPFYRTCGGIDSHRVCNLYGQCWMVCD